MDDSDTDSSKLSDSELRDTEFRDFELREFAVLVCFFDTAFLNTHTTFLKLLQHTHFGTKHKKYKK